MTAGRTVVTFCLDATRFALPVAPVLEILEARDIAPLPRMSPVMLGLIDRRGVSVPVIDLRLTLGMAAAPTTDDTRVIVLRAGTVDGRNLTVGVRVDRVIEVTELDGGAAEPLFEADLLHWHERTVSGIGRRHDEFVTLLDVDGLFAGGVPRLTDLPMPLTA